MDRNQITGLILIFLIVLGWSYWMSPSKEEREAMEKKRIEARKAQNEKRRADSLAQLQKIQDTVVVKDSLVNTELSDSIAEIQKINKFGIFAEAAKGEETIYTLENDKILVKFSSKGAYPVYAELKNFKSYDGSPLILFDKKDNDFGLLFNVDNLSLNTKDLYFVPTKEGKEFNATKNAESIQFRASAGNEKYVEFAYSLSPESNMLKFDIRMQGLQKAIPINNPYVNIFWNSKSRRHEKGTKWENQNTTVYYKYFEDEVSYLTETAESKEEILNTRVRWIAYKGHFFTSALIAQDAFSSAQVSYTKDPAQEIYLKKYKSNIDLEYNKLNNNTFRMAYYMGPNDFDILSEIKMKDDDALELHRILPLGWAIFRWINQYIVINLFNFLGSFISNYGIIILIMTIIIKIALSPLTYKSYVSSAKMRVLKPQIDEINKKIPKEKAMERQQATMNLYKKVGVNPMGGCLPMLIQFPFLIAMFKFFPASIELRQKSFLWADDLSTYDSIWTFPGGFEIPFYGDHISLFTLLMAGALLFQTLLNQNQTAGSNQMPGMKMMLYLMPAMMLFWFNDYSAGLSYYYFLSNIITIGQTLVIRKMINEEDILKKLNENKKKPKKKSKFQERLEKMGSWIL